MKINFITAFIDSTMNVMTTMGGVKPTPGSPFEKVNHLALGDVTGIIGMAGEEVSGNMVLTFESNAILKIVSNMLMEEFSELDNDVVDAVGELTNIVSGGAKAALNDQGYSFEMASPIMVKGKSTEIQQFKGETMITIPFEFEQGKFWLEASLKERA